jgi:Amt family ammonium transporter
MEDARKRRAASVGATTAFAAVMLWCATQSATRPSETSAAIDTGDTAWMLVSCALVLVMTPGLALFYGGLVR